MGNELTVTSGDIAAMNAGGSLGDMIKPLIREIHLFDTFAAGTSHLRDKSVLEDIKPGDGLKLRREDNEHDPNAVMLLSEDGRKVGYIPRADNIIFSRLMDAGKMLTARVSAVETMGNYTRVELGIYLVDF